LAVCSERAWATPAASNDLFKGRTILRGTEVNATGSNVSASKEPGEPAHAENVGGSSVWWTWTAPASGEVRLTTDGSDFDTLLAVYAGPSLSALSLVASNDDHGALKTSRVRFQVAQGIEYQIAVDGFNDGSTVESGSISLRLAFKVGPIVRPANDDFTERLTVVGGSVEVRGSSVDATREAGEPYHDEKLGDTSIWWSWVASFTGTVVIRTAGSTFDTVLAVYLGPALADLKLVVSDDDEDSEAGVVTSLVVFEAAAGANYQIAVDGFDGATGEVVLSIQPAELQLSGPLRLPDGSFEVALTGVPGRAFEILASVDLKKWMPIGVLTNRAIVARFTDLAATNLNQRFYRAMIRP
jgi:hypothetical protein